jgi:hypothetical protein
MKKEYNYKLYYTILQSLVKSLTKQEDNSIAYKAYYQIIKSFVNYVDTGEKYYLDSIIYSVEDSMVSLPSELNNYISRYIDTLASDLIELDSL